MGTAFVIGFVLFLLASRVDWGLRNSADKRVVSWEDFARRNGLADQRRVKHQ
jgi:hypothetical protein